MDYNEEFNIVFYPNGLLKIIYDYFFIFVFVITSLFLNSTKLTFYKKYDELISHFDIILDIFFVTDIVVNLNTGYYDDNNNYINNYRLIFFKYLHDTKAINILANFPFIYFIKNPFFYAIKLLRFNKILYHKYNDE